MKHSLAFCLAGTLIWLATGVCAHAQESPASYCNDPVHALEFKCLEFLGANADFFSLSGNVAQQKDVTAAPTNLTDSNSRYIAFLHYGGGSLDDAKSVAKALQQKAFRIGGIDKGVDSVGGPGVDYFQKSDLPVAQAVADIVNLQAGLSLAPRYQSVNNPPGYLGVWLNLPPSAPPQWNKTQPSVAWCYQEDSGKTGNDRYTVNCHWSLAQCGKALNSDGASTKTTCQYTDLKTAEWKPGRGFMDSYFQYSPTPLPLPFPQLGPPS